MKSILLAILIGLLPLSTVAIGSDFVKLRSADFSGLDIQARAQSSGALTYVIVKNDSPQRVTCEASFRNGPELPKIGMSRAEIEPSSTAYLKHKLRRSDGVVKIDLMCGPT